MLDLKGMLDLEVLFDLRVMFDLKVLFDLNALLDLKVMFDLRIEPKSRELMKGERVGNSLKPDENMWELSHRSLRELGRMNEVKGPNNER